MTRPLLHLLPRDDWAEAQAAGVVAPSSLREVGFVHCSYPEQAHLPANALFRGRRDLIALVIDPRRVEADVRDEDLDGTGTAFPHVYGAVPLDAVVAVLAAKPTADGDFEPFVVADLPP